MSYETRIKRGIRPRIAKSFVLTKISCLVSLLLLVPLHIWEGLRGIWPELTSDVTWLLTELFQGD